MCVLQGDKIVSAVKPVCVTLGRGGDGHRVRFSVDLKSVGSWQNGNALCIQSQTHSRLHSKYHRECEAESEEGLKGEGAAVPFLQ